MDESGTHAGALSMCVAGFTFDGDAAIKMSEEWSRTLAGAAMPFMHMAGWTKPNAKPYSHLSMVRRIEIQTELISIVNRYKRAAFMAAVNESEFVAAYSRVRGDQPFGVDPSAYSFCLSICIDLIRYLDNIQGRDEVPYSYFFEAGHRDAFVTDRMMQKAAKDRHPKYRNHAFMQKTDLHSGPLQAADMLAWLGCRFLKRRNESRLTDVPMSAYMRKDLLAITRCSGDSQAYKFVALSGQGLADFLANGVGFNIPGNRMWIK